MDDGRIFTRRDRFARLFELWHLWAIMLLCVVGSCLLNFAVSPHLLDGPEVLANADIAREITAGRGFHTRVLTPLALTYVSPQGLSVPDVEYPPLFAILLAVFTFPFRTTPGAVIATCTLLHLLTAASLFIWVSRLTRDVRIACTATLMLGLSPLAIGNLVSGSPVALATLLVTNLFFWLAWLLLQPTKATEPPQTPSPWRALLRPWVRFALAGVLCGLATLTDYRLGFLAPLALVAIVRSAAGPRYRLAAAFLGGTALALLPWAVRNWHVTGSPIFSLYWTRLFFGTDAFPAWSFYCRGLSLGERLSSMAWQHKSDILVHAFRAARTMISTLPIQFGPAFAAIAVISYCARLVPRWLTAASLAVLGTCLATAALWAHQATGLLVTLPILALVAAIAWVRILDRLSPLPEGPKEGDVVVIRLQPSVRSHAVSFAVLAALGLLGAEPWQPAFVPPQQSTAAVVRLVEAAGDRLPQCILTDIPWDLTWYTGRTTCALPVSPGSVAELNTRVPIGMIALSQALSQLRPDSYLAAWHEAWLKPGAVPDYQVVQRSLAGALLVRTNLLTGVEAAPQKLKAGSPR